MIPHAATLTSSGPALRCNVASGSSSNQSDRQFIAIWSSSDRISGGPCPPAAVEMSHEGTTVLWNDHR